MNWTKRVLGGSVGSPTEMHRAHTAQQLGAECCQNVHPIVGSFLFKLSSGEPCTFADPLAGFAKHIAVGACFWMAQSQRFGGPQRGTVFATAWTKTYENLKTQHALDTLGDSLLVSTEQALFQGL